MPSRGYAYDEIEAGLAADATNLPDLKTRVDAIHRVREEPGFLSVVLAAKRIANIVKDAPAGTLDETRLVEPAEKDLATEATKLAAEVETAAREHDYVRCLTRIGELARSSTASSST